MKSMNKTLIFPFSKENYGITKELIRNLGNNYLVCSVQESRNIGFDISHSFNKPDYGCVVQDIFTVDFGKIDEMIFLKCNDINISEEVKNLLEEAVRINGINISPTTKIFGLNCEERNSVNNYEDLKPRRTDRYFDLPIPVVGVGGIMKMYDNHDIIFNLRAELRNRGYRVSTLIKNQNNTIVNINNYPDFLFDDSIGFTTKITALNRVIKNLYINEKPDVILIESPGALLRLNSNFLNGFSEFAHILSETLSIDYFICNLNNQLLETDYVLGIKEVIERKYNFLMEAICISNAEYDWKDQYSVSDEIAPHFINMDDICSEEVLINNLLVGNIYSGKFVEEICDDIIKKC